MRIAYAFFCEDLRTEVTGQVSAVGLWGAQCNMGAIPGALRALAFHAFVEHGGLGAPFRVSIAFPGQAPAPDIEGVFTPDPATSGQNFNFLLGPVMVSEPGEVRVRFQILGSAQIDETFLLRLTLAARSTEPPAAQH